MVGFEWDPWKSLTNEIKHGVKFEMSEKAFADPQRQIYIDELHSVGETRWYCLGLVDGRVMTVRFVYRMNRIRILGAGYWRKGKRLYEEASKRNSES